MCLILRYLLEWEMSQIWASNNKKSQSSGTQSIKRSSSDSQETSPCLRSLAGSSMGLPHTSREWDHRVTRGVVLLPPIFSLSSKEMLVLAEALYRQNKVHQLATANTQKHLCKTEITKTKICKPIRRKEWRPPRSQTNREGSRN